MKSVAVIGGGITGLTAAFRLSQKHIPVTVYEASDRVGGVIQSLHRDGYLAEFGPNTLLETSPKIGEMIRLLGLEKRRLYSDEAARNRYLVRGKKPIAMPDSFSGFLRTPLFSAHAKWCLFCEPFIPPWDNRHEESVAEFVVRRLGQEFLSYAIDPLVGGIYAGDPYRLSVLQAFPKLYALEQRYGSLIKGQIFGAAERKRRAEVSKQDAKKISFDEGLQVMPDTFRDRLGDQVILGAQVINLNRETNDWTVTWSVNGRSQSQSHAAVLFAGPAYKLAEINLTNAGPIDLSLFGQIHYPPVASIVLGFRRSDVAHPLDGFGILIPKIEGFHILGTLFSSSLFPGRAPDGHVALTSYIGGTRCPHLALKPSEALVELTVKDLRTLLGITGSPTFQHCILYPRAIPQYEVGYGRFKSQMDRIEVQAPGLFLAGHYRHGVSLSDSLVSGYDVADRIEQYLERAPSIAPNPNGSARTQSVDVPLPQP
ncbi:MAG: protoporphyrinogen oxidase [Candidatus Omnitrophica bacterium]|nr:protoporphyrinogen oxidase [Candidatus Omnitrophota bacterium]